MKYSYPISKKNVSHNKKHWLKAFSFSISLYFFSLIQFSFHLLLKTNQHKYRKKLEKMKKRIFPFQMY